MMWRWGAGLMLVVGCGSAGEHEAPQDGAGGEVSTATSGNGGAPSASAGSGGGSSALCTGCVVTIGGDAQPGFADGADSLFAAPLGVAVDSAGRVFVADELNHAIRVIVCDDTLSCNAHTVAGTGAPGYRDGPGSAAQFENPVGITVGNDDQLYVVEFKGHRVRELTCDATECEVSTLAGTGTSGFADGPAHAAQFNSLDGVAVTHDGRVLVVEELNNRVREITCDAQGCMVSTLAGTGAYGDQDGSTDTATFDVVTGIATGADGTVYVTEWLGNRIRAISGAAVSTFAGTGLEGLLDGPQHTARFAHPRAIAAAGGTVYVADQGNHRIRVIVDGMVQTLAGGGELGPAGGDFADGPVDEARFNTPRGVAVDMRGRVYVADTDNNRVRVILP